MQTKNNFGSNSRPLASAIKDIEKRPSNMVLVSPELATLWLTQNIDRNRPESRGITAKYARIMKRGEWRPNPSQPISFTKEGILVNGQHRLKAVESAGIPVMMAVVWDADEADFDVIDTGKKRSLGDIFALSNIANSKGIAAAVVRCVALSFGRFLGLNADGSGGNTSNTLDLAQDYLEEYYKTPDLYQEVYNKSKNLQRRKVRAIVLSDMCGIAMYLITKLGHDKDTVIGFWDAFYNGGDTYPYLQDLTTTLNNDATTDKKMTPARRQSLIAKAWNMYLVNSHATRVRVHMGEIVNFR